MAPVLMRVAVLLGPLLALAVGAQAQLLKTPEICPDNFQAYDGTQDPVTCACDAEAARRGSVWGSEPYTSDSGICAAAVHAGAIPRRGGVVTVLPEPGLPRYPGSTRNGVQSINYGPFGASFRFERQAGAAAPGLPPVAAAPTAPEQCPDDFIAFQGETDPLACLCPAEATGRGAVWGTDVYTSDSAVCRAAVHAGVLGRRGGAVTVVPEAGRGRYPGTTRNGVQSMNYGAYGGSYRFEGPVRQSAANPAAIAAPTLCPDDFQAFRGEPDPLACLCPAEATLAGSVWGSDVYTDDSRICRAALHAGAIPRMGGSVAVVPEPGRRAYPGVTRNGVSSANYGEWQGSFRFEGVQRQAANAPPVQAPVGAMLKQTGQVQLYITFRIGSADLDMAAAPVLLELRDALMADGTMALLLTGHTDSTGNPAANRALSLRRAESVRTWLVGQGLDSARLQAAGAGQDQPIAENTSDAGRALNRRVQAARLR